MIELCTIDLDGTLFDAKKNISQANIDAIQLAKKNGCKVVIASGRPLSGIIPVLEQLNLNTDTDYVICYNGAKVINIGTRETIFENTIQGSDVKKISSLAIDKDYFCHAFKSNGELITTSQNQYTDIECKINHITAETFDFQKIEDNESFIKCMIVDDPSRLDTLQKTINEEFHTNYTMVRSSKIFLEFLNPAVDKGQALVALAKYLGISMKNTMAIGDAGNDYAMIQNAHIGVAMENAFPEIIKLADYITSSNEDSGVAKAINKFINKI